jgi:uncharacterized repeat protein (TIGR03803 family)
MAHRVRTNVQTLAVLHSFAGPPDGEGPTGTLLNVGGTFYGTSFSGGASNEGIVFEIFPDGAYSTRYSFSGGSDGANPTGRLANIGGTLYGVTRTGGASGNGTVFSVNPSSETETVLHSFSGGSDGASPLAGLVAVNNTLYGTTQFGGTSNNGTVFKITAAGKEKVIHSFAGGSDGENPASELLKVGKLLYGTTAGGGASSYGTVFSVSTTGTDAVLHSFSGSDGAVPFNNGGLINHSGVLYGTTQIGGTSNNGTIFKITTAGAFTSLYSFTGSPDGSKPSAGLANVNGTLFGATTEGGSGCGGAGCGVIFALLPNGPEIVVYSFTGGSDGDFPYASMINVGGTLYGITLDTITNGPGKVFSLSF